MQGFEKAQASANVAFRAIVEAGDAEHRRLSRVDAVGERGEVDQAVGFDSETNEAVPRHGRGRFELLADERARRDLRLETEPLVADQRDRDLCGVAGFGVDGRWPRKQMKIVYRPSASRDVSGILKAISATGPFIQQPQSSQKFHPSPTR